VTGGARGIGYACAERILASGAAVSLWDQDGDALAAAATRLGKVHSVTVDITAKRRSRRQRRPRAPRSATSISSTTPALPVRAN